jgi:carboxyl-terminal processing protease
LQTIFPLDDGSALKLTVAKYYTPSHKVIHQQGIAPDVLVPVTDSEEAALLLKRSPGGGDALNDKQRATRWKLVHDEQVERAEALLKGLIRYKHLAAAAHRSASLRNDSACVRNFL